MMSIYFKFFMSNCIVLNTKVTFSHLYVTNSLKPSFYSACKNNFADCNAITLSKSELQAIPIHEVLDNSPSRHVQAKENWWSSTDIRLTYDAQYETHQNGQLKAYNKI